MELEGKVLFMEEIFDFDVLKQFLMGDETAAKDILQGYILQCEKHLPALEILLKDASFDAKREEIRRKAHLLKGSSLNVSAKDFAQTMLSIEKTALEGSRDELLELYNQGMSKWNVLKEKVEEAIKS